MVKTKRVQVLMEIEEFDSLEKIAKERGSSVAELMRDAARRQHLAAVGRGRRVAAAERFLGMASVELPDWQELKRELDERYATHLS